MGQSNRSLRVEVPSDVPVVYANFAVISHSATEIVIDLAQILPNAPHARVQVRVVLNPLNAKTLYMALGENLSKYENRFGPISFPQEGTPGPGGVVWRVAPEE